MGDSNLSKVEDNYLNYHRLSQFYYKLKTVFAMKDELPGKIGTEVSQQSEPTNQKAGDFWLQEYDEPVNRTPVFEVISPTEPDINTQFIGDSWLQEY